MNKENKPIFNTLQQISIELIKTDMRFLYTVIQNYSRVGGNYIVSLFPYIGLITDGAEDWLKAYNNSSKIKLDVPMFDKEQQAFFEKMRSSIKIWENDYDCIYKELERLYTESDLYFSEKCEPIARELHLYDIFGAYVANKKYCGNTILFNYYVPNYNIGDDNGELLENMGVVTGKYGVVFDATESYTFNTLFSYEDDHDYGGFVKSPVGDEFSDKFVLFSILCEINFVLECVDKIIDEEIQTKLRFAYLLYYYLLKMIPQINKKLNTDFRLSSKWFSDKFRNSMAHYGIGVDLKEEEIVYDDPFYGLTQKYFCTDYFTLKNDIIQLLSGLVDRIDSFLNLKGKIK